MELEDTEAQALFRRGFKDWLGEVLQPGWIEAVESEDEAAFTEVFEAAQRQGWNPFAWTRVIGESGYGAPLWPREYGGLSGETWMLRIVREELIRYRLPTFGPNILGLALGGPTLIAHGTDEQKDRHLRPILLGEEIWCQLFSEPGAGSDLASLSTRAVRDGDEWIIDGQKVWTTLAQFAQYGLVLTRTDPDVPKHEGLTYFILPMQTSGVTVRPLRQMTGTAEFNEVFLEGVRLPDSQRVGGVGDGWRCARTTLANERDTIAGLSLDMTSVFGGMRKDPWKSLVENVTDRSDPMVRQRLAQLYIEQRVKDVTVLRANAARAAGRQPGPEGSVNKIFNAEFNQRRAAFTVDVSGPNGVAWAPDDSDAESRATAFLRSRANTLEGGTAEVLRTQVAERVLGLPREEDPSRSLPWKDVAKS